MINPISYLGDRIRNIFVRATPAERVDTIDRNAIFYAAAPVGLHIILELMTRRTLCALLLALLLAPLCWSQPVEQSVDRLTTLSSQVSEQLQLLRSQSSALTRSLRELQTDYEIATHDLVISQTELQTLREQSQSLQISLDSINEQLRTSYEQLRRYEARLRTRGRIILVLAMIVVVRTLGMIAGYLLYARGIKVPRWIDILL